LDALEIDQAVVMGHSMGGFIAQAIALDYPERVSGLVLCSTNFGGPNHVPITAEAWAVLSDTESDPLTRFTNGLKVSTAPGWSDANPEMVEQWVAWRIANPMDLAGYQAQMAIGLGLISPEAAFENRLPEIDIPTLILFGAHDKVVPPANADLLAAKISNSKIVILPDAGHFFPIEVAEAASQAVIDFAK
jgi:pimeloyl-ACP methyl ester carboxylesterase